MMYFVVTQIFVYKLTYSITKKEYASLLSVAFFALFGILTVIIKYLQLLVDLVFKRKQYNFESIEKLTK